MQSEHNNIGWRVWGRWVLATAIGWSVGIVTAFIAAHLIAPIVYIAIPHETNLVLGLCLGAAVGYMQRRFAQNPITASGRWVLSTSVGMGIPYVVLVIANEFWGGIPGLSLVLIAAVGGLITGLLQLRNVRRHSRRSGWWVLANIVGWGLGWLAMSSAVGLLFGGVLLGMVTGGATIWLLRGLPTTEQGAGQASPASGRDGSD